MKYLLTRIYHWEVWKYLLTSTLCRYAALAGLVTLGVFLPAQLNHFYDLNLWAAQYIDRVGYLKSLPQPFDILGRLLEGLLWVQDTLQQLLKLLRNQLVDPERMTAAVRSVAGEGFLLWWQATKLLRWSLKLLGLLAIPADQVRVTR